MSEFNLLIVKTSSLGDIVHTLPAIHDIHLHRPDIKIDWLVESSFSDIARLSSGLRNIIEVESKKISRHKLKLFWSDDYHAFTKRLRSKKYNLLIDAQGLIKSGFMCKQADKDIIAGYDRHSIREPLASMFYTNKHAVSQSLHAVERTRRLCALALSYDYPSLKEPLAKGQSTVNSKAFPLTFSQGTANASHGKSIIFCHGSSRMDKTLPITDWRELAKFATQAGFTVTLPQGNKSEALTAHAIAENIEGVTVLPPVSLDKLIEMFKACDGSIGVDTGFTHLSGALNKPTIGLYGPTNPILCGALGKHAVNIESEKFTTRKVRKIDKSNMKAGLVGLDLSAVWDTFMSQYHNAYTKN